MPDDEIAVDVIVPDGTTDEEWHAFLGQVGADLVEYIASTRFDTSGEGEWPPTAFPRVAQLISDINRGSIRAVTFDPVHQTGVVSGLLRRSVQFEVRGSDLMLLAGGPDLEYARRFHSGGTSRKPIDQSNLRRLYRTNARLRQFIREHRLGWLFAMAEVEFEQPARPLITTPGARRVIQAAARDRWPELN